MPNAFSELSLKASQADGYYHPPDWDPTKRGRDSYQGSKGANQWQQYGIVRFESPWAMHCLHCKKYIGRGHRYNMKKDHVGNYFSTKIYEFTGKCEECKGVIKMRTDPKNCDYKCVAGVKRTRESLVPTMEVAHDNPFWNTPAKKIKRQRSEAIDSKLNLPVMEVDTLKDAKGGLLAMAMTTDGNYLMAGGQDRIIRLWNPHKRNMVKEYKGHGHTVYDICISKDKKNFASVGSDKAVFYWNVSGQIERRLYGHDGRINCVEYNNEYNVLMTGSYDSTVKLWDLRAYSQRPIQTLKDFKDSVSAITCTDTEILATSVDGHLRIYDVSAGKVFTDCISPNALTSVQLSGDEKVVLMSCMDGSVRLFDRMSGEQLNKYEGHVHQELHCESLYGHGEKHVISASEDGSVHFWDLLTAKTVHCLQASSKAKITRIQYHPKDVILFVASMDGNISIFK